MKRLAIPALAISTALGAGAVAAHADQIDLGASQITARSENFSGDLKEIKAPEYDGPVKWGPTYDSSSDGRVCSFLGLGALGLFAGGAVGGLICSRDRSFGIGALAGALIGAGGSLAIPFPETIKVVEFKTSVSEVVQAEPSHYEQHGKVTSGPYFSQVVAIPESEILLAANQHSTPLIPGQQINAKFFVNLSNNRVVSWVAEPALRPGVEAK